MNDTQRKLLQMRAGSFDIANRSQENFAGARGSTPHHHHTASNQGGLTTEDEGARNAAHQ